MTFNIPELKKPITTIPESATDPGGVVFHRISTSVSRWDTTSRLLLSVLAPATRKPGGWDSLPSLFFQY